jgi:hypothetical protein
MPKPHTKNNPIFFMNSNVDSISPKGCQGFKSIKKLNEIRNLQLYMPNPPYKKQPNSFIVINVDSISLKECKGSKSIKQLNFVYPNIKYLTHNYFRYHMNSLVYLESTLQSIKSHWAFQKLKVLLLWAFCFPNARHSFLSSCDTQGVYHGEKDTRSLFTLNRACMQGHY